ncbi:inner membrane-spanning protein YciB [Bdellovibrio reynosensis]|uniref:Septation protein IspZ n=1 Tax=Bdellovibrio reynosensis TaxID=2835041 RepID=A0ABY4CGZ3_9BACT|nr:septation protein IspZ [Bdellovibrio reynosensis]UOF01480.1 septation protein IspZ [Bdellovibrio reynosensis]
MKIKEANPKAQAASLFFAGLLPVIAFTVIEEYYGIMAGLIAGMIFGAGEIIYELIKYRKVQKLTWFGNGMLLGLGAVSLISSEGIWFKLQPAIMEGIFAVILWGSVVIGKPLLSTLAEMQGAQLPDFIKARMKGMTIRSGFFFAIHTGLAIWAAFKWSSRDWALLKGVGLTVSFILYLVIEGILIRRAVLKLKQDENPRP